MENYYNYTKKQLITRIRIEKVRPIFSMKYYKFTKKKLNYIKKERLVYLLIAQEMIIPLLNKNNVPLDCQRLIFENL